jgi:preprotein translocase subunit SecG
MKILLLVIEFITSIALILAILLHTAKGEGLGAIGGQARLFGSQKDLEAGLNKVTTILAVVFIISAIILSILF